MSAVVESYEAQAKGHKSDRATKTRLPVLSYKTAERALKYLSDKLQIEQRHILTRIGNIHEPQWLHRAFVKGVYIAGVPTIRKNDSRYIGIMTTVVRLVQHFGYDKMEGFKEYLEAEKVRATESARSHDEEEVERTGQSHGSSSETQPR